MSFRIVKITLITFILFLLILVGFGFFLRSKYIRPVLMYHYIIDTDRARKDKRIVTPKTFEEQMRFLKANEYNVISLEQFAELLREKKYIPKNTVVITFDDGHMDNYENAYPVLKKYNLPATMFVIVDSISKPNFMTQGQIRQMSDSGLITIGSHTLSEPHLPSINNETLLRSEIYDSKKKLEEMLNRPVNCFSYPIGGFDVKIREMVIDAGYKLAVATSPGIDYSNDDPFAIKRVRISENSKNLFIFWFESSGLYKYILELRKKYELQRKSDQE